MANKLYKQYLSMRIIAVQNEPGTDWWINGLGELVYQDEVSYDS